MRSELCLVNANEPGQLDQFTTDLDHAIVEAKESKLTVDGVYACFGRVPDFARQLVKDLHLF